MVLYKQILKSLGVIGAAIIAFGACRQKIIQLKSPPGYDFASRSKFELDPRLKEISGLAWDHQKNEFFAINDESGKLFILDKTTYKLVGEPLKFAGSGDYEDIAVVNSVPYVLKSDASLTRVDIDSAGNVSAVDLGKLNLDGGRDFESLYYDPARKALVLLCKNCAMDDKKKVSAFAYYIDSARFDHNPLYRIDIDAVKKLAPLESSRLEPSAAAVHPLQQKLYILSSGSNELVITDLNGNVEAVYALEAKLFPQAESLTIKQNGDMYIANEGGNGKASLLYFGSDKKKK